MSNPLVRKKRWMLQAMAVAAVMLLVISCSSEELQAPPAAKNATVSVALQDARVAPGGILHYNMTIANLGLEKNYDVAVEHRLFSTALGRSIKSEGEIIRLDAQVHKDKAVPVPSDAPAGSYQLIVAISYGVNTSHESGGFFEVVPNETNDGAAVPESVDAGGPPVASLPPKDAQTKNASSGTAAEQAGHVENPAELDVVVIEHKERSFVPAKLTVRPKTVVRWINRDKTSALVEGPGFHSNPLGVNGEFKHTFLKPGIFEYYSQLTKASGTIIVEDPDNPLQFKRDPMSFKGGLNS